MQASHVSARLRKAGFGVVSTRRQEGIRVTRGALSGQVHISVDLDRPNEKARTADALANWLSMTAPGLRWKWQHRGDGHFVVQALLPKPEEEQDEEDGAPRGLHLVTDPIDSPTNRLMEQDLQAQREAQAAKPERSLRTQRKLNDKAQQHAFSVRVALAGMCTAVYDGTPPRQADIDKATQQLDALITMAKDWSR